MIQLLTVEQVGNLLSVKTSTIYNWVHKEEIPYVKVGRLLRFDQSKITEWVNQNSGNRDKKGEEKHHGKHKANDKAQKRWFN